MAVGLGVTAAISLVSFAVAPSSWFEWFETLRRSTEISVTGDVAVIPGPLWARTAVAASVALLAGWRGWHWLVPIAVFVALPVPWSSGLSLLVGSIALSRDWWGPRIAQVVGSRTAADRS